MINHRAGDIANRDGFTANHIENTWKNVIDRAGWGGGPGVKVNYFTGATRGPPARALIQ